MDDGTWIDHSLWPGPYNNSALLEFNVSVIGARAFGKTMHELTEAIRKAFEAAHSHQPRGVLPPEFHGLGLGYSVLDETDPPKTHRELLDRVRTQRRSRGLIPYGERTDRTYDHQGRRLF